MRPRFRTGHFPGEELQSATTARSTARVTLAPTASARANPITGLIAGLISTLENAFGVNTRYAPANPAGKLLWGMFRSLNNALGFTPVAGTPTVGKPDPSTGTVTGTWSFTQPAGLAMTYVYNDPSMGDVTVYYDGTFSYTPSQAARQSATGTTTDSFKVVATDVVAATVLTITVPVLPLNVVTPGGIVGTIEAGTGIRSLAISPDGRHVYVLNGNTNGNGAVTVIDTATGRATGAINLKLNPQDIAVSPNGRYVYVADSTYSTNTTPGGGAVQVIDTATNAVIATIPVSPSATTAVAISPDGTKVYAVDVGYWGNCSDNICDSGSVNVISTVGNTVVVPIRRHGFSPSFHNETAMGFSPDGAQLYVTGRLFVRQTDGSTTESAVVAVIDTATNAISATIKIGGFDILTEGMVVSPDGAKLYVVSNNPADSSSVISDTGSMVSVVDTATGMVTATIPIGDAAAFRILAISPDGRTLYAASDFTNTVTVIDTATNRITNTIRKVYGAGPIVVSPDGKTVYVGADGGGVVYAISV